MRSSASLVTVWLLWTLCFLEFSHGLSLSVRIRTDLEENFKNIAPSKKDAENITIPEILNFSDSEVKPPMLLFTGQESNTRDQAKNSSVLPMTAVEQGISLSRYTCPPSGKETAYRTMRLTIASFGAVLGLVLLLGGIKIPKVSTIILFGISYGTIGYALVWFGVTASLKTWYDPFVAGYVGAAVCGLIFALVAAGSSPYSAFTVTMGAAAAWLFCGIMLNTAGIYRLGTTDLPYFTFSITAGVFYVVGLAFNICLVLWEVAPRRLLAVVTYCFVGAYLVIKFCGIAAQVYPNEFCSLRADTVAGSWQYYICFACTFLLAFLCVLLQMRLYAPRLSRDFDEEEEEPFLSSSNSGHRRNLSNGSRSSYPKHATSRKRFKSSKDPDSNAHEGGPQFGGFQAFDQSAEYFVRQF